MPSFTLLIDTPALIPGAIQKTAPEGVRVDHPPMPYQRSGAANITFNFALNITFDEAVSAAIVAAWLCRQFFSARMRLSPRINGKHLPNNEAEITKLIEDIRDGGESERPT